MKKSPRRKSPRRKSWGGDDFMFVHLNVSARAKLKRLMKNLSIKPNYQGGIVYRNSVTRKQRCARLELPRARVNLIVEHDYAGNVTYDGQTITLDCTIQVDELNRFQEELAMAKEAAKLMREYIETGITKLRRRKKRKSRS